VKLRLESTHPHLLLCPPVCGKKRIAGLARLCERQHACRDVSTDLTGTKYLSSNSNTPDLTGTNCAFMNRSKSHQILQAGFEKRPQTSSYDRATCLYVH
jgi:hypothetical protein